MNKIMFLGFTIWLAYSAAIETRAQAKPDLVVSKVGITKDASGFLMDKISVTVANLCRESQAATSSYVMITFKQNSQKGAKAIFYVGNTVKALKGGESYTQTFDVAEKKIGVGRHVLVEADPYKKVSEASENNNWRTLFPDGAGTLPNENQCSPKR